MTDNDTPAAPRSEREQAIAAVLDAIVDLTDPADTEPAQALYALSEIIGTARTLLRPYRGAVAAALGDATDRRVADRLYQAELAMIIAGEHAETGAADLEDLNRPSEAALRYVGIAAIGAHFGVTTNTAYGWVNLYPPTHPDNPSPEPDAYLIEQGRVRGLWIAGNWGAWDAWKRVKDARAFRPRTEGEAASGKDGDSHASA
jgi:hypothetical protein